MEGDDLLLKAETKPPTLVLELLSNHKADILTLLQSGSGSLDHALLRLECVLAMLTRAAGNDASATPDASSEAGAVRPIHLDGQPRTSLGCTSRQPIRVRPTVGFPDTTRPA
jgi:hypothetical protein